MVFQWIAKLRYSNSSSSSSSSSSIIANQFLSSAALVEFRDSVFLSSVESVDLLKSLIESSLLSPSSSSSSLSSSLWSELSKQVQTTGQQLHLLSLLFPLTVSNAVQTSVEETEMILCSAQSLYSSIDSLNRLIVSATVSTGSGTGSIGSGTDSIPFTVTQMYFAERVFGWTLTLLQLYSSSLAESK